MTSTPTTIGPAPVADWVAAPALAPVADSVVARASTGPTGLTVVGGSRRSRTRPEGVGRVGAEAAGPHRSARRSVVSLIGSATPAPPPSPTDRCAGCRVGTLDRLVVGRSRGLPADAGMATAEYAVVTIAAVAFGGLLITILSSAEVRGMLLSLIRSALSV